MMCVRYSVSIFLLLLPAARAIRPVQISWGLESIRECSSSSVQIALLFYHSTQQSLSSALLRRFPYYIEGICWLVYDPRGDSDFPPPNLPGNQAGFFPLPLTFAFYTVSSYSSHEWHWFLHTINLSLYALELHGPKAPSVFMAPATTMLLSYRTFCFTCCCWCSCILIIFACCSYFCQFKLLEFRGETW